MTVYVKGLAMSAGLLVIESLGNLNSTLTDSTCEFVKTAGKNIVSGLSESAVLADQFSNKREFLDSAVTMEIVQAFLEVAINFGVGTLLMLAAAPPSQSEARDNLEFVLASLQVFKYLKLLYKVLVIARNAKGDRQKLLKMLLKLFAKESVKVFGKNIVSISIIGNILGSVLSGLSSRFFIKRPVNN